MSFSPEEESALKALVADKIAGEAQRQKEQARDAAIEEARQEFEAAKAAIVSDFNVEVSKLTIK